MSSAIEDYEDRPFSIRPAPNTCCPERNDRTIREFGYCNGCNTILDLELFKKKAIVCLEQKERLKKWLEKEIKDYLKEPLHIQSERIKYNFLKEVLELMK